MFLKIIFLKKSIVYYKIKKIIKKYKSYLKDL